MYSFHTCKRQQRLEEARQGANITTEFRLVPLIHLSLTILDFLDLVIRANSVGSWICRQIVNLERNRDQQLIDNSIYVAVNFLFKLIFYFLCFRVW